MRALAVLVGLTVAAVAPAPAAASPVPPGALQLVGGPASGTGVDASRLGYGYQFGGQASWQPMSTEQRIGWAVRWSTMFGKMYGASAARIDDRLLTVLMDVTAGLRFRPWSSPRRYLTARGGIGLLRSNEEIAPSNHRDFLGPVASVGVDQYAFGSFILSVDVRYGMISNGPGEIGVIFGAGLVGP